jgi:hypothetical protein
MLTKRKGQGLSIEEMFLAIVNADVDADDFEQWVIDIKTESAQAGYEWGYSDAKYYENTP